MEDQRVGERLGVGDAVRRQRRDRRRLEHANGRGGGGDNERDADSDRREQPGEKRQVQVEPAHQQPERERHHEPGGDRPDGGDEPVSRTPQRREAAGHAEGEAVDIKPSQAGQPQESAKHEPDRPLAVDDDHDDHDREARSEGDREDRRRAEPGHMREPGHADE